MQRIIDYLKDIIITQENTAEKLILEIENLSERIDKAIDILNIKQTRYLNESEYVLDDEDLDEIINILTGDKND